MSEVRKGSNYGGLLRACCALIWLWAGPGMGADFSELAGFSYQIYSEQIYLRTANQALALDVYVPQPGMEGAPFSAPGQREASAKVGASTTTTQAHTYPVLMYIHGGGWAYNSRHDVQLRLLPFLAKGYAVVNIDYRKIDSAPAPAAIIDARCALNWIRQQAGRFQFDLERIIVSGNSAGGHLALMTALATDSGKFDRICWDGEGPHVAAVINWYGITDVYDLVQGENIHAYALQWLNASEAIKTQADLVSPLTYIGPHNNGKNGPAVFSIHGDRDSVVPYSHSLRLHQALQKNAMVNQLLTIKGKGHGDFSADEIDTIYQQLWAFLEAQKLLP